VDTMDWNLFSFPPAKEAKHLNPLVLAYIGDAIYEVFIRQYLISLTNHRPHHLHKQSTSFVSARAQSKALTLWLPLLTEVEMDMVKRGRNAKSGSVPKNSDVLEYRHSTAFECLIGFLYYQKQYERLNTLMMMTVTGGS
jgi:ribonuclease-3 family protein